MFRFCLTNTLAHPFSRPRFARPQEDPGPRLREHGFGLLPVAGFHLAFALKANDEPRIRLAALGQSQRQRRQHIKAREFVENYPDRPLSISGLGREPENQEIEPETQQGPKPLPRLRRAGQEQPALSFLSPFSRCPVPAVAGFGRQQSEGIADAFEAQSTPLRCCGARLAMNSSSGVLATRMSISGSASAIHWQSSSGVGRYRSRWANSFRGLSTKNRYSRSRSGYSDFARVSASA